MNVVRLDGKGRVVIPRDIREKLGLRKGSRLRVSVVGGRVILEPVKSVASKYYGIYKPKCWPEDLDQLLVEVIRRWGQEGMSM